MLIRTATPADIPAAAALEAACFPPAEAATEAQFADRIAAYGSHFWLMFEDGELISMVNGFVSDEPDLTDEMYADASMHCENGAWQMIFGVLTHPDHRKKGCAAALLHRAVEDARKQGRRGLVLTCKDALLPYYAKFGFVNEGTSVSVHGNVRWNQMRLTF